MLLWFVVKCLAFRSGFEKDDGFTKQVKQHDRASEVFNDGLSKQQKDSHTAAGPLIYMARPTSSWCRNHAHFDTQTCLSTPQSLLTRGHWRRGGACNMKLSCIWGAGMVSRSTPSGQFPTPDWTPQHLFQIPLPGDRALACGSGAYHAYFYLNEVA